MDGMFKVGHWQETTGFKRPASLSKHGTIKLITHSVITNKTNPELIFYTDQHTIFFLHSMPAWAKTLCSYLDPFRLQLC